MPAGLITVSGTPEPGQPTPRTTVVVVAPSFEQWGVFWDGYEGSPAAAVDAKNNNTGTVCPNSGVWESEKIAPKK